MSTGEFEAISAQLGPGEWYELGLTHHFPYLDPGSLLGEVAIEVTAGLRDASRELEEMNDRVSASGADRSDLAGVESTWLIAIAADQLFHNFYTGLLDRLEVLKKKGETPGLRYELIAEARDEQIEEMKGLGFSKLAMEDLIRLAERLGGLYQMESSRQFIDLQQPPE